MPGALSTSLSKSKHSSPLQQCSIALQTWERLWHLNPATSVLAIQCLVNGSLMRTTPIAIIPRTKSGFFMNIIRIMSLLLEEELSKGITLTKHINNNPKDSDSRF